MDFINDFDQELIRDKSYYLHKVDSKGRRVYIYNDSQNSLNLNNSLVKIENGTEKKFKDLSMEDRRKLLSEQLKKNPEEVTKILQTGGLDDEQANLMVENCIGQIKLPLGLAQNFVINQTRYQIPMATEEPSVIAAASYGAKIICENSVGFRASSIRNIMRG